MQVIMTVSSNGRCGNAPRGPAWRRLRGPAIARSVALREPHAQRPGQTMTRYSAFGLLTKALGGHAGRSRAWRDPEPRPAYDVIIIGGGGHGLASAYYLAKEHGITNVAVLEKGPIGLGNTGRNRPR